MTRQPLRPDWDHYFLGIAYAVAARADCRRAKVGCVIVDRHHRVCATGYNGSPPGDPRSCLAGDCPRGRLTEEQLASLTPDYSNCIACHAEMGAVAHGDVLRMRGGTAYLTMPPCDMCEKLLASVGIAQVVFP